LYFDLFNDYNSEFEFKFEKDKDELPEKSKDNDERPVQEPFWYPVISLQTPVKLTTFRRSKLFGFGIKLSYFLHLSFQNKILFT
jgi:hypothetical protein